MHITGTIGKIMYRNRKTGEAMFTLLPDSCDCSDMLNSFGNMLCKGTISPYQPFLPVKVSLSKNAEEDIYDIWSCVPYVGSRDSAVRFLSSPHFDGIGEKTAADIVDEHGYSDLFSGDRKKYGDKICRVIDTILGYDEMSELVIRHGGTYCSVDKFFDRYGMDAVSVIKNNPYVLCDDIGFTEADRIADELGMDRYDKKRIRALIGYVIKKNENNGNTCMQLSELYTRAKRFIPDVNSIHLMTVLTEELGEVRLAETGGLLYSREMHSYEKEIAYNISKMNQHAERFCTLSQINEFIGRIEREKNIRYSEAQKKALRMFTRGGVKVITGGPGTGKTTVIDGIISLFRMINENGTIALAAPTANAARRIREKTGIDASTVHKLLEIRPFNHGEMLEHKELVQNLVIVDEGSFLDIMMAAVLFQSVKCDTTIVFVGDAEQLPSVGPGNFFMDLIKSESVMTTVLDVNFRQENRSGIVNNAVLIRKGETDLFEYDDFEILRVDDDSEIEKLAIEQMEKYYEKERPFAVRLYSPIKKEGYTYGTRNLNKNLQEIFNENTDSVKFGANSFKVGDPVIFTRNCYEKGYCNGDEGVVTSINDDVVTVRLGDLFIEMKDLDDLELSYAITTHKSQGSECDVGIVIIPSSPASMLYRNMVYVASTRARKKTILIVSGNSLETAIANVYKRTRVTGLEKMLREVII